MATSRDEIQRMVLAGSGWPPIWCAAMMGDNDVIRKLLAEDADPNAIGDRGCSTLQVAVVYGQDESVDLLLRSGADPNQTDPHGNGPLWTAVHHACLDQRTEANLRIIRLLLAGGADPDHKNKHGRSPREMAQLRDKVVAALFT